MTRQKKARANVVGVRQTTQYTCVSASTCMALNAVGVKCTEDQVNEVIGAKPMHGARWEEVLACAQYFGCRATLTTPATLTQVKAWTDQGKPVLIAWNPEGREWSHASLIYDVTGEKGDYIVHVADPNIPNPDKTVREIGEDEFYSKWFEKWPNYLVRRPALMIEREVDPQGRQIMASERVDLKRFMRAVKEVVSSVRHLGFPFVFNKWSSKITKEVAYISYKLSAVGITNLSVDFLWDANGEVTAQVIEGTKVLHTVSGLRYFPSVLNLLPNTTSKLASSTPFSCLFTATNASVGQVERALASIPAGLRTNREVAIAIADQLKGVTVDVGSLSLVDVVLRDLNNLMAGRVARVHLEKNKWEPAPPKQLDQDQQEQVWEVYDFTYAKMGKHLSSKSALMSNYDIFWIVDVDGDDSIDAFIAYSTTASGKKIGLMGSNGVKSSMMAMLAKVGELLLSNGWYAEVDKKFMRIAKRARIPHITDEAKVREVLAKPLVWNEEAGSYERNLEGLGEVTKYLIGNPL